jgi:glycosyltransferase involved in cell wall biosynthesis
MRVLMVSAHGDDETFGGVERLLVDLSSGLARHGAEVAFLQAFPSRAPRAGFERTVLHRTDWRDDRTRRLKNHLGDVLARPTAAVEEAIARGRPDVVHTHNLPGITTSVWEACRRLGVPVVHSLHDYYLFCPRVTLTRRDGAACRPSRFLCGARTRRLVRWAPTVSHLVGVSRYVLDLHAQLFPNAEPHLVRHPMPAPAVSDLRPPRDRPAVLGYIGALDRIKGVDLLLDALPRLEELGIQLRVAGRGRLEDAVAAAARDSANLVWEGSVLGERKQRFFEECDLGVVPSVWAEPGGPTFTMIEWLGARRPVLVSTRGGLGEVAGAYPGSIAIQPTAGSIVSALAELVESQRWQQLVAAVRPIESEPGIEEWVERHLAIYRSALR